MRNVSNNSYKQLFTVLIGLCLTLLCSSSWANGGSNYMVTFKDAKTYNLIKQQISHPGASQARAGFLSAGSEVKSTLDHLNILVVNSREDLSHLTNNPNIFAVEKEIFYPLPRQVATFSNGSQGFGSFSDQVIDMPWGIKAVNAPAAWSVTKGKGIKVMVIDTGVDKDHPALKGRFISGKNFYPRNPSKPSPAYDYFDDVGHGTHVAGTVLADGLDQRLVGVAPEADFYAGRVCSSFGCSTLAIVQAINWAIDNNIDVLNLSLGGPVTTKTQRAVYQRAEEMGVTVIAASGNSAGLPVAQTKECRDQGGNIKKCYIERVCKDSSGRPTDCRNTDPTRCDKNECTEAQIDIISFPAGIETVVAVGAVSEDLSRANFSQFGPGLFVMAPGVEVLSAVPSGSGRKAITQLNIGDGFIEVPSNSFQGSSVPEQPVVGEMIYAGLGKKEDFEGKDLRGKVALIQRGEIFFSDKVKNALAVGASGVIIFNNVEGLAGGSITEDGSDVGIPVVMIELSQGQKILQVINDKSGVPEASVVIAKTDHSPLQGTSMASPHVCGVAALIIAANPSLSPAQVREVLAKTSTNIGNTKEYGNGLVNSEAAVAMAMTLVGEKFLEPSLAKAN